MILSVPVSSHYGAGICGFNLLKELAKLTPVKWYPGEHALGIRDEEMRELIGKHHFALQADANEPLIQIAGPDLGPQIAYRGKPNIGYIFFERPLTDGNKRNLARFDRLAAGSTWNANLLKEAGFDAKAILQGVDTELFKPDTRRLFRDKSSSSPV